MKQRKDPLFIIYTIVAGVLFAVSLVMFVMDIVAESKAGTLGSLKETIHIVIGCVAYLLGLIHYFVNIGSHKKGYKGGFVALAVIASILFVTNYIWTAVSILPSIGSTPDTTILLKIYNLKDSLAITYGAFAIIYSAIEVAKSNKAHKKPVVEATNEKALAVEAEPVEEEKDTKALAKIESKKETASLSKFDGGLFQYLGWRILGGLLTIVTFGICTPVAVCMIKNWETKHTIIDGKRLKFDGRAIQLWGNWIKWFLLTVITLGIYGFWVFIKMRNWVTKHTHFED